jgi:hypothetical protein
MSGRHGSAGVGVGPATNAPAATHDIPHLASTDTIVLSIRLHAYGLIVLPFSYLVRLVGYRIYLYLCWLRRIPMSRGSAMHIVRLPGIRGGPIPAYSSRRANPGAVRPTAPHAGSR